MGADGGESKKEQQAVRFSKEEQQAVRFSGRFSVRWLVLTCIFLSGSVQSVAHSMHGPFVRSLVQVQRPGSDPHLQQCIASVPAR